jgi:hypothetical protein
MILPSAPFVNESLCCDIGMSGFFLGCEDSDANVGRKFTMFRFADALREVCIFPLSCVSVLHVDGHRHIAKIINSVVKFVSVNMVNLTARPFAVSNKPGQSRASDLLPIDGDFSVSVLNGADFCANTSKPLFNLPSKHPRDGVVTQKVIDSINGNGMIFHLFIPCNEHYQL